MEFESHRNRQSESLNFPRPTPEVADMAGAGLLSDTTSLITDEKAIEKILADQTMDFSVRFERASESEQINRMRFFADLIVSIARTADPNHLFTSDQIVDVLAKRYRVPVSDVNYGLLYAIRSRRLGIGDVADGKYII